MSVVRVFTINCDLPRSTHLGNACVGWVAQELTLADARTEAKRQGWKRIDGSDYCPNAVRSMEAVDK